MKIDSTINLLDNTLQDQNSLFRGRGILKKFYEEHLFHSRVRVNFPHLQVLRKNTQEIHSVESFSVSNEQGKKQKEIEQKYRLISRFLKILKKKFSYLQKNEEMAQIFSLLYQGDFMKNDVIHNQKPDMFLLDSQNCSFQLFILMKFILLAIILIIIPYLWCFGDIYLIIQFQLDVFLVLFYTIDIILQFNLAKIIRGQIIYNRLIICRHYLKSQFVEDFIFTTSLSLILYTQQFLFIFLFYIFGTLKLFKIIHQLEDYFDLNYKFQEVLKLTKLLFLINLLSHFIACIWINVGKSVIVDENTWIDSQSMGDSPQYKIYIASFYWSVTTMVTVGYGDISPKNYVEQIVCVFVMFLSCGVYGYSLNIIGQIVSSMNHYTDILDKKIRVLNKYFRQNNIDEKLQSRIKNYLEYKIIEEEALQGQNIYTLLDEIPSHFKQSIIYDVFLKMLKNCSILTENFSSYVLKYSANYVQPQNYSIDEYIIDQNKINEAIFYFIDSGIVEVYEQQSKVVICQLEKGQFFGEYEFFTNFQSKFSIKCKTNTTVFKLSRQDFLSILQKDDFEMFHKLKTQFEFQMHIKQQQKCLLCQLHEHVVGKCNKIFYAPDLSKLFIRKQNLKQFRRQFKRSKLKFACLSEIQAIQVRQFHFQQDILQEGMTNYNGYETQAPESFQNFSLLNGIDRIQENREMQRHKESDKKEYVNLKSKQSQTQIDQTGQQNQRKPSYIYIQYQQNESNIDIDRMKEYNSYFIEYNYEYLIKKYNQNFFQNSLKKKRQLKLRKANKLIKI